MRSFDVLVLDYGGVCTLAHGEFLVRTDTDDTHTDGERTGALGSVRQAHRLGMTVVVLSNEIDRSWTARSPTLSSVDHVLACTDNGILKPDRRAYQRALLVGGCTADRALFVDDDIDNIRGAEAAGLATIHFDTADPARSWAEIEEAISGQPTTQRGRRRSG